MPPLSPSKSLIGNLAPTCILPTLQTQLSLRSLRSLLYI
jgi:hypothetical protein